MVTIQRGYFVDSISQGQFGKANLIGYFPGQSLAIAFEGYRLVNQFILEGVLPPHSAATSLMVQFRHTPHGSTVTYSQDAQASVPANPLDEQRPFVCIAPFDNPLRTGSLQVTANLGNDLRFDSQYTVLIGNAPVVSSPQHSAHSRIVTEGDATLIPRLLGHVREEIIVLDQYLTAEYLYRLCPQLPEGTRINVFIRSGPGNSDRFAREYIAMAGAFSALRQRVEVRVTAVSHDRFIVINGTEYYHLGYSLKDLERPGIVWRYEKLADTVEIDELARVIAQERGSTHPLF